MDQGDQGFLLLVVLAYAFHVPRRRSQRPEPNDKRVVVAFEWSTFTYSRRIDRGSGLRDVQIDISVWELPHGEVKIKEITTSR
jgi:hypothetical protein